VFSRIYLVLNLFVNAISIWYFNSQILGWSSSALGDFYDKWLHNKIASASWFMTSQDGTANCLWRQRPFPFARDLLTFDKNMHEITCKLIGSCSTVSIIQKSEVSSERSWSTPIVPEWRFPRYANIARMRSVIVRVTDTNLIGSINSGKVKSQSCLVLN
jgi:hypothetical protein